LKDNLNVGILRIPNFGCKNWEWRKRFM